MPSLSSAEPVEEADTDLRRDGRAEAELSLRLCLFKFCSIDPEERFRECPFSLISSGSFGFLDKEANHS
jgi:hypothetical protein